MGIKNQIVVEPVRSLSGLLFLGSAVITALAFNQGWSGEAVGQIAGLWSAFIAFLGTFFVRNSVTPNIKVDDAVHDTIVALAPLAPQVINAVEALVPKPEDLLPGD